MRRIARNYDPAQLRDPDGKWGDGLPGSSAAGMSWSDVIDSYGTTYDEAVAGDFTVAVFESGDFTLFYQAGDDHYEPVRELDNDYAAEIADALDAAADDAEEQDLGDDEESEDAHDFVYVGENDAIVGYTNGGQVMFSASKSGAPVDDLAKVGNEDADQFWLSPDGARDLAEAVRDMVERYDEVNASGEEGDVDRAAIQRKYNPGQPRIPGGMDGGQWAGGPRDALRLDGKINLEPGESLIGSGRVDAAAGGIRMALTERDGRQMLRFGAGGEGYGQRNRDERVSAWNANPSPAPLSPAERQRLTAEDDALVEEYDEATPERQDQIESLRESIQGRLTADDQGFNGTANIDEYSARRLADRIRPALAEAVEQEKIQNEAWDEIEALEAKGDFDPARMAELRRIARVDETSGITFDSGIVAGSEWGDVHYAVLLDDPTVGAEVEIGVKPKNTPDDWGDDKDWMAKLDAAETRKFLRLLDKMTPTAQRSYSPENGPPAGGQFAPGGGRVGGGGKKPAPRRRRPAPPKPTGPMSFDGKSGTGYGIRGGDPQVRTLQAALSRLGVTDSDGKGLAPDGKYGPKTTSAVKKLQKALGVEADGKVTPELLKQVTDLKQLPAAKPRTPRKRSTPTHRSASPHEHVLDNGICTTCAVSRSGHEHVFDNGVCRTCH